MERLTEKRDGQNVIPLRQSGKIKWAICSAGLGDAPTEYLYGEHADRLAAYEDTGLEPEEIQAIAGLASENCAKTADAIDKLLQDDAELKGYRELGPVDRLRELVQADREGRCVVLPAPLGNTVYRIEYVDQCQGRYEIGICKHRFDILFYAMECRNFGKTVFLTRAEAEAALRREQDGE